jgi:hypothetical protein
MKDLLKRLSLEELRELGQKYLNDYSKKLNSGTLAAKLASRGIDEDDIAWIKESAMSKEEKVEEEVKQQAMQQAVQKPQTTIAYEHNGVMLSSAQMEANAKLRGEQEVAYLVAQAKKEASKTVIAYVSPLSREDLSIGKTAEAFITGNAYFTISCVVPFNVYVEIPKCIAECIRETRMPIITELTTEQAMRFPNQPSAVHRLGNKYNIQVMSVKAFEEQRQNGI